MNLEYRPSGDEKSPVLLKRIAWIDEIRAFAMFCIVLGHTLRGASIYPVIYAFHVPLCIIVTGYCFSDSGTVKEKIIKIIKRIYCPYILIYIILGPIVEGESVVAKFPFFVAGMIYGNGYLGMEDGGAMRWNLPLWYLPFITCLEILQTFIIRLKKKIFNDGLKSDLLFACISFLIAYVGYGLSLKTINLPYAIETVIFLSPFFWCGKTLKHIIPKTLENKYTVAERAICGVILIAAGIWMTSSNGNVDYVCDAYGNSYVIFLLAAFAISVGSILCIQILPVFQPLIYLGKNTIPVLGVHKFPIMAFVVFVLPRVGSAWKRAAFPISLLVALVDIFLCLVANKILESIIKEMKRKKVLNQ